MARVLVIAVDAVGGYLKALPVNQDGYSPVGDPGIDCVFKESFNFGWSGGSGDIPVYRHPVKQAVAHAAADCIGFVACGLQPADDGAYFFRQYYFYHMLPPFKQIC